MDNNNHNNTLKWDPVIFNDEWEKAERIDYDNDNNYKRKELLKSVATHNCYLTKNTNTCVPTPITYKWFHSQLPQYLKYNKKGMVVLEDFTTDDAIVHYTSQGYKPVALNFANGYHVGGGILVGAAAQEEDLCRQYPTLYNSLLDAKENKLYPIKFGSILITHNVKRVRENRNNGYKIIPNNNITSGFITAAAPNMRIFRNVNKNFSDFDADIRKSLDLIFTVPVAKDNYNVCIIGSWGCGAFAPTVPIKREVYIRSMASLILEYANKYGNLYDVISISVPDKTGQNYQTFSKILNK